MLVGWKTYTKLVFSGFKKVWQRVYEIRMMISTLVSPGSFLGGAELIQAGLSLRELIHEYKHQTLVLFKCALLQPKVDHQSYMVN